MDNFLITIGSDIINSGDLDNFGIVNLSPNGKVLAIGAPSYGVYNTSSGFVQVYDLSALLSSDEFVLSQFTLSPNPATNQFSIQLPDSLQLKKVSIYNQLG